MKSFAEEAKEDRGRECSVSLDSVRRQQQQQRETVGRLYRCKKPVIAALNGAVAGAGLGFALAADFRVGTPDTVVTSASGKVGLSGDYGVAWFLHRLVGPAKAREILFSSEKLTSSKCSALGLINRVVATSDLSDYSRELAKRMNSGASYALQGMKSNLLRADTGSLEEVMDAEVIAHHEAATTEDHRNAAIAFEKRREPVFSVGWHSP